MIQGHLAHKETPLPWTLQQAHASWPMVVLGEGRFLVSEVTLQVELLAQFTIDVRLPGKGNSNSHGARPIHLIITMIKWIRTSRMPIKKSLPLSILCLDC